MRIIECDRCHKRIEKPDRIGYVALNWRDLKTDALTGENPTEDLDFCDECMDEITAFISRKPAADEIAAPQKKRVDVGKIRALSKAGWSVKNIAEEVGCSEQTVYKHIKGES